MTTLLGFDPLESSVVSVSSNIGVGFTSLFVDQLLRGFKGQALLLLNEPRRHWDQVGTLFKVLEDSGSLKSNLDQIATAVDSSKDRVVLILDSVTQLLFRFSLQEVANFITNLQRLDKVHSVVGLLISGCHDESVLSSLNRLSSTSFNLTQLDELSDQGLKKCEVKHQPKIGKALTKELLVKFDLSAREVIERKAGIQVNNNSQSTTDHQGEEIALNKLTTFNIGLTEQEKKAREKLVLPFWRPEQRQGLDQDHEGEEEDQVRITSRPKEKPEGAKFYYQPDEADDWDEEDPDDDLDF